MNFSFCGKLGKDGGMENAFITKQAQIFSLTKFQVTKNIHNEKNCMPFVCRNASVSVGTDFF